MKKLVLWGLVVVVMAVVPPGVRADFSQDFQTDTSGWFTFAGSGNVNQEAWTKTPRGWRAPKDH